MWAFTYVRVDAQNNFVSYRLILHLRSKLTVGASPTPLPGQDTHGAGQSS
jgi:hypothetical protein